ncbi:hypothetical protein SS50377_20894 [Spironucleus salmonicida]|uniref:Uncharacterized protein n=1 Tax=Spironucleus salmonicida TaxID=348837 RepID=V6LS12_9EUKA|nr:hypothetical protein SS50377_20894 [Spironucleus salmonicida]|eukprot:EST43569.1 Hypothetical protein SS50377_16609 [Spironucleus salmonicida]
MDQNKYDYLRSQIMQGETNDIKLTGIRLLKGLLTPGGMQFLQEDPVFLKSLFMLLLVDAVNIRMEVISFLNQLTLLQNSNIFMIFSTEYEYIIQRLEINVFREQLNTFTHFEAFISLHYMIIHNLALQGEIFENVSQLLTSRIDKLLHPFNQPILFAVTALSFYFENCYEKALEFVKLPGKCQSFILDSMFEHSLKTNSILDIQLLVRLLEQTYFSNDLDKRDDNAALVIGKILVCQAIDKDCLNNFTNIQVIQSLVEGLKCGQITQLSRGILQILTTISCCSQGAYILGQIDQEYLFDRLQDSYEIVHNLIMLTDFRLKDQQIKAIQDLFMKEFGIKNYSKCKSIGVMVSCILEVQPSVRDEFSKIQDILIKFSDFSDY